MRTKERITSIRKQSKERVPRENLWYYNESNIPESAPSSEKKQSKFYNFRTLEEDFDPFALNKPEKRKKNDCSFVVDWQMSEF
jgi:hypothetical protein